jgi:hypothetical protein
VFWGQLIAVPLALGLIIWFIREWRRQPGSPAALMLLASSSVCWLDPLNNWAIHLVYNPDLWHFPKEWPWVGLSPIIEPIVNVLYAPYLLVPYLISMALLRKLQARGSMQSFAWRRPKTTLAILTLLITILWDSGQEIFLVLTQLYTYTHVMPFGSIFVGTYYQFPLLLASVVIGVVMIPTSLLMYRDDTGLTEAEKLAKRLKLYVRRPATATFLVMALTLNLSFLLFIGCFALVRVTGAATAVACPWPYQEAAVYDPHGYYEREGQPGPYTEGWMNNWIGGQPDGRPTNVEQISDRCAPHNWNAR